MNKQILEIPSTLFYQEKLICCANFPDTGPKDIPPVGFIGIDGQEEQTGGSPSYYNVKEAHKIAEKASLTSILVFHKIVCVCIIVQPGFIQRGGGRGM